MGSTTTEVFQGWVGTAGTTRPAKDKAEREPNKNRRTGGDEHGAGPAARRPARARGWAIWGGEEEEAGALVALIV